LKVVRAFNIENYKTYSTKLVDNDASARAPKLTSASYDLDLWPPDPRSRPFHAFAPWTTCINVHRNRFIRFQNIAFS